MEKQEIQMIQGMFETLMVQMQGMQADITELKDDMSTVKDDILSVKEKVTRIDVTIENEIRPNIKLLAEGQEVINQKLDRLEDVPERLENLEIKVDAMSPVVREHSITLKKIK